MLARPLLSPQARNPHVSAWLRRFSPTSHHPFGAPSLPAKQQVRSWRGARILEPVDTDKAHTSPLTFGYSGHPERTRAQLPGHPATSILHPGVTLWARSFLFFPQLLPDPISSPHPHSEGAKFSSIRESLVRNKVNGGTQNGRWQVPRACQKRGAPRPFAHPPERLETRPSATRSDDSLTRSVP